MIWFSKYIIFLAGYANQGVLSKDLTIWLVGARPANTCIPPSFPGIVPTQLHSVHIPQKYIWKYIKIKIAELYINQM